METSILFNASPVYVDFYISITEKEHQGHPITGFEIPNAKKFGRRRDNIISISPSVAIPQ